MIELHGLSQILNSKHRSRVENLLDELLAGHEVVHLHANNSSRMYWVNGLPLPEVIELTLASRHLVTQKPIEHDLPTHFDRPNDPNRRDHLLPLRSMAKRASVAIP